MFNQATIRNLLENAPDTVLSLYLHVNPAHRPNQNEPSEWKIFAKNALRDIESSLQDGQQSAWENIRQRTEAFLQGYIPAGKSLVLFVGEGDWLENYDLPIALDNHAAFGELDVVRLLWAIDEYERYLVVLVDSQQAHFHSAYLGRDTHDEAMSIDFDDYDFGEHSYIHARSTARSTGEIRQGGGPDAFEDMKSEHVRRFHHDVAQRIQQLMKDVQANRVILGGNEQAAHQVKRLLHTSLKAQVGAILPMRVDTPPHVVADSIEQVAFNLEREYETELVQDVINLAKAGGRGALGYEAIIQALQMQQVELLILPYPNDDVERAAQLTLQALKSGSEVELVHGSAAAMLQQEGHQVAARLYYRIGATQNT